MIKKIDRGTVRQINAEIEDALQAIAEKHGIQLAMGSSRFNANEMATRVTFKTVGENGESKADKQIVELYVGPNSFGREFQIMGRTFRLDGYNTRGKRTPVLGTEVSTGRRYRFPLESVRQALVM